MLKLSLCDYSDAYILLKVTASIVEKAGDNPNNNNKDVVFKNYVPFTDCISEINDTQIHNASASFRFKQKMTGKTADGSTKDVEIMVSLKHFSNFWRTLQMSSTNFEINLALTWSSNSWLSKDTKATTFAITDTKIYVPVVTLSTQYHSKLW